MDQGPIQNRWGVSTRRRFGMPFTYATIPMVDFVRRVRWRTRAPRVRVVATTPTWFGPAPRRVEIAQRVRIAAMDTVMLTGDIICSSVENPCVFHSLMENTDRLLLPPSKSDDCACAAGKVR
uniref:Uncharacterized protein n=1 Tax=Minutocellus polymorphus TaxID=265543 RepID=A0A7S0AI57_9STRA